MKRFSTILSIYILCLIAIPCVDNPVGSEDDHIVVSTETQDMAAHQAHECTPFCSCSCCVATKIHHEFKVVLKSFEVGKITFTPSVSTYKFTSFTSILQPPQVA